jgi:hypothetical protein
MFLLTIPAYLLVALYCSQVFFSNIRVIQFLNLTYLLYIFTILRYYIRMSSFIFASIFMGNLAQCGAFNNLRTDERRKSKIKKKKKNMGRRILASSQKKINLLSS